MKNKNIYVKKYRRQDSNLRDINAKGYEPSPIVHSGTSVFCGGGGIRTPRSRAYETPENDHFSTPQYVFYMIISFPVYKIMPFISVIISIYEPDE